MAKGIDINFDDVEEGGGGKPRVPEGDYRMKITGVKYATSQAGNPMLVWSIKGLEGKAKNKEWPEYTTLTQKAAFKLRNLIECATGKAPKGKISDARKLLEWCKKNVVGKEIGCTMEDDEYTNDKGKTFISSNISDYLSIDDLTGADIDDDEAEADDDVEEDDDDDESEDDDGYDEMDRKELKAALKEKTLPNAKKSESDDDLRARLRESSDDDDDEELEDVDLDEL